MVHYDPSAQSLSLNYQQMRQIYFLEWTLVSQLDMCSADVLSIFEIGLEKVTPLRWVQVQKQKERQSTQLINCAAYVVQAPLSLWQFYICILQGEMCDYVCEDEVQWTMGCAQIAKDLKLVISAVLW